MTPIDIAPYLGRIVLSASTNDSEAFQLALRDAYEAGVTPVQLLVLTAQSLASQLDQSTPDWQSEVRLGLLEAVES